MSCVGQLYNTKYDSDDVPQILYTTDSIPALEEMISQTYTHRFNS